MTRKPKNNTGKAVTTLTHEDATRKNIPTAEYEAVVEDRDKSPIRVALERRNRDLDPQLIWRGKEDQDKHDLIVFAPPLYIQEKVHPKALIDDLLRETGDRAADAGEIMPNLFADFNGLPKGIDKTEFYKHDQNWSNRMILGDSLQAMESLAEREGLRGKVQCIYFDPPYGIKFSSNFQWSTTSRDVKDGDVTHITREPEQVSAFRDTWRDGIHSYLSYLRDRLLVARDLMADSGTIFIQIGDENAHRVRALMDEVFGEENFQTQIAVTKTAGGLTSTASMPARLDYVIAYAKDYSRVKYRQLYFRRDNDMDAGFSSLELPDGTTRSITPAERASMDRFPKGAKLFRSDSLTKPGPGSKYELHYNGKTYTSGSRWWGSPKNAIEKLIRIGRVRPFGNTLRFLKFLDDFPYKPLNNLWDGLAGAKGIVYVVQTNEEIVKRCILMATDPGDLVLDPTCGSGTTAVVAEHWARRWITIDTSRVALALARARIMGAQFPYYLLADSKEGQVKEAALSRSLPSSATVAGNVAKGFVLERAAHVTLASIANNAEIDVILENWELIIGPIRKSLMSRLGIFQEEAIPSVPLDSWQPELRELHSKFWESLASRKAEIEASILAKAEFEYLYDRPIEDGAKTRVAGPFTVESLSPHRIMAVGADDQLIDLTSKSAKNGETDQSFAQSILVSLKSAGVQQSHKDDKIDFTSLKPWPGSWICAEGRYTETGKAGAEKRAAIFIGPEFGTVTRADLVSSAREAADVGFDLLIACAFNFEAHTTEFNNLGKLTVLKARMNADLHMSDALKNTGKGNLFVVFGEPDIDVIGGTDGKISVKINGVDVFHPSTGEVRSDGPEGIACWFIDTDYNEESFFVRQAYFLGANDPYGSLKATLKAEIDEESWQSLNSDTSRSFGKPKSGRIAIKVINHLGDEVMKVFRVT